MARVNWIQDEIYLVILDDNEGKALQNRADKDNAGSRFLGRCIASGLMLGERFEDSKNDIEDSG